MIIETALTCDNNYAWYCAETIVSLLKNTKEGIFYNFYIISIDLTPLSKERILKLKKLRECNIEFIEFNDATIKNPIVFRLKLASLLPQLDKIIYTDCDVTFLAGLDEIWEEDINDYYFANIIDFKTDNKYVNNHFSNICKLDNKDFYYKNNLYYFNSGFFVMNLKKIREFNIEEQLINFIKNYPSCPYLDQDAINIICFDKIKPISCKWSFLISYYTTKKNKINRELLKDVLESEKNIKMIHFVADKKPTNIYINIFRPAYYKVNKYKKLFWEYVALTDWKDEKKPKIIYKFPLNLFK